MAAPDRWNAASDLRSRLIREATRLAGKLGQDGIVLSRVAAAAEVTKGGLLHHFPSKAALLSGMFDADLAIIEHDISERLSKLPLSRPGRFTHAYGSSVLDLPTLPHDPWSSLITTVSMAPPQAVRLGEWWRRKFELHSSTDGAPEFTLVRLAIDGALVARVSRTGDWSPDRFRRLLDEMP